MEKIDIFNIIYKNMKNMNHKYYNDCIINDKLKMLIG